MHQSDSAGLFDVPNTESRSFVPAGRAPMGAVALGLAAVLALGAGEAAAQDSRVCANIVPIFPEGTTEERVRELSVILRQDAIVESPHVEIYCRYGRADRRNRGILVHNPQIVVVDDFVPGIEAFHEGVGDLSVYVHARERGTAGDFIHPSPVDYGQGIFTTGKAEDYITGDDSYGIHARHTGEGRAGIDVRNVSVRTTGDYSHGVYAWQQGSYILRREDGSVASGYVWDEDAGFFRRNEEVCSDCRSIRARGRVSINLIETDLKRDQRVRPLIATSGDYADALRAEYTRAAARGHIAVTVEGYTLTTGGILPEEAIVSGVDPEEVIEVTIPRPQVYDPSKISIVNPNHDPSDPNSPEFINIVQRDDGSLATDLRPYTAVYIPVRNPDYDPEGTESSPWNSGIALWNGRYFLAMGRITEDHVSACQGEATADARRACYENKLVEEFGTNLPTGFEARGIYANHEGHGDIRIRATDGDISTQGEEAQGIYATHTGRTIVCGAPGSGCEAGGGTTPGGGGISIVVTGGDISTQGGDSHGVWARHRGDSGADEADSSVDPDDIGTGNVSIAVTDADIDTAGADARGVYGLIQQTCTADTAEGCKEAENLVAGTGVGDIDIDVTRGSIDTVGVGSAYAVHARHENTGAITVSLTGVAAATEGNQAHGVFADHGGSAGAVSVTVDGGSVATQGDGAHGVYGDHAGSGDLTVDVMNGAAVTTKGIGAQGVRADHAGDGSLTVNLAGGVTTEGESSEGVLALHRGSGALAIGMMGGAVKTTGLEAHGLYASHTGAAGTVSVTVSGGSVTAEDANSAGVLAHHGADDREGAVTVTVGRGASVTGGLVGIQLIADADADGNIPTRTVNVDGTVRGVSSAGIHLPTGGTVNVGATGRVSGGSAGIFSNGDHDTDVTVEGTVDGDILGEGTGDHTVMVMDGGTVGGTILLDASTVTVDGTAGRVWLRNGGAVTVSATGKITGIEVERDGATVREAVRSDTGGLTATLAGMLTGDVLALGTGTHLVTVAKGGGVSGTVRVATPVGPDVVSTLKVNGMVGRVRLDQGGRFTVGPEGEIPGIDGISASSDEGDIVVVLQESSDEMPGESAGRIGGSIKAGENGRAQVLYQPEGSDKAEPLGRLDKGEGSPNGPYDIGVEVNADGSIRVKNKVAPRGRLYEALPSVMLGLNRLSEFRDRMAAPRDASGGWARVHGSRGEWKADNTWPKSVEPPGLKTSTVVESSWSGIQAGLDAPVGDGLFGISLHHRNGSATVSNASTIDVPGAGTMDLSGTGGGISGTWFRDDVYVDLQAEVSWYKADFSSSIRGMLKEDVSGYGYALGVEAGRRIASGTDGVAFIPRAGLVHSKVSLTDFKDADSAGGSRVSLEDGRSLMGRMGVSVDVETKLSADSESRFLYSLDVEREFKDETMVSVAGVDLASTAEATWLRAGMNVSHAWDDGRYTIQGGVSYATAGSDSHEYGGGLRLKVRF